MKKIIFLIFLIFLFFTLTGCAFINEYGIKLYEEQSIFKTEENTVSHEEQSIFETEENTLSHEEQSVFETEENTLSHEEQPIFETEEDTMSYEEQLAGIDAEYALKLKSIKDKYDSDLSYWSRNHALLKSELENLKNELYIIDNMYQSQIDSLVTASYMAAEAAGKQAYDETYSKKMAQAAGFGSSSAVLAAESAYRTAYERTLSSYQGQIASLKNERTRALIPIQGKIDLQNSLISSSSQEKQLIEDTYSNSLNNLNQWYASQKSALDLSFGK